MKGAAEGGVYLHGFNLEGASWDRRSVRIVDAPPKVLFSPLPVVKVTAVNIQVAPDRRKYVCPVYRLPRRTALHYVFDITLPTEDPAEKWTLRGVAALLSTV